MSECFEAMLAAIDGASRSVRLEMYIFTEGSLAELFRASLVRAAERGVQVRVLIDAFGSLTLAESFWEPLGRAGGEFRWFNPLQLRRLAIRNHRKLLACDDTVAFVGGFNIAPEYEGDGLNRGWYDLGLQLSGPLVAELARSFDRLFALADFRHRRFVRLRPTRLSEVISTSDGQLLLTAPGLGRNLLQRSVVSDLRRARVVKLISGYFVPTRGIRRALHRVVRRGGRVQLLLAGRSDVPLSQMASRHFYRAFLRAGVEIYEYEPQILHAKLFLIDDIAYVGSANLDRRSLFINYELLLRLPNPGLVRAAGEIFDAALLHSRRIEAGSWARSRTFFSRLQERWAFFLLARVDPFIAHRQLQRLERLR